MNLLSVKRLAAGYGSAQALFDVSFDVGPGEVVSLLGRNGMGRSTVIKCLFGLIRHWGGDIEFAGTPVGNAPAHKVARLGLGLVPEGRQIFPRLTVEQNLLATSRKPPPGHPIAPWHLERIYALFPRLHERRSNYGNQLSGGEQQMLAIGRALLTNPRLLVLDEATEGLSPLIRRELWRALEQLKSEGMAQIIVDKNLRNLLDLADRHVVIEKGRSIWTGDSDQLASSPDVVKQHLGV